MRKSLWIILTVLLVAIGAPNASANTADIIFNTFGPGNSYDTTTGQQFYQLSLDGILDHYIAVSFVPTTTESLGQILVAVNVPTGESAIVRVTENFDWSLLGGTDGPGVALESFTLTGNSTPGIVDLTSGLNPVLTAGQTYWVQVDSGAQYTVPGTWYNNNQGITGEVATNIDFCKILCAPLTTNRTAPAVEVLSITPTPEPATLGMFAAGAALMGLLKRKRLLT
jgi:hypothetical protein